MALVGGKIQIRTIYHLLTFDELKLHDTVITLMEN